MSNKFIVETFEELDDEKIVLIINKEQVTLVKTDDKTYTGPYMFNRDIEKIESAVVKYKNNTFEFNEIGRDIKQERMEKVIEKVKAYIKK